MIPKIIHYCWFGGNPLPELAIKCIASWKKYFPDYEIKEWNETNYDVHKIIYTSEAYYARKYAFVSDYARFDILYQYGGIYFDTDVEVIKPFDDILKNGGFMGFELTEKVNAGLGMGFNAGLEILCQILEFYASLKFINSDGSYNTKTVVEFVTDILKKIGLKDENKMQHFDGFIIYPVDFFCPMSFITGKIDITENTHSIHHFEGSWITLHQKEYNKKQNYIFSKYRYSFGKILIFPHFLKWQIREHGLYNVLKKIIRKLYK